MANKAKCSPRGMQISVTIVFFKEGMNHKLWTERLYLVIGNFHGAGGKQQGFDVEEFLKPIKNTYSPFPSFWRYELPCPPPFFFDKDFKTTH